MKKLKKNKEKLLFFYKQGSLNIICGRRRRSNKMGYDEENLVPVSVVNKKKLSNFSLLVFVAKSFLIRVLISF